MPMDFPDMKSLIMCARVHKFRKRNKGESEREFREALALYVEPRDRIEAEEIRNKVGWDKFTEDQNKKMLLRNGFNI